MASYTIVSPIHVIIQNKNQDKYALNFNRVRNLHGFVYNKLKERYSEIMLPKVSELPSFNKVHISYTLYTGSSHKSDLMNWVSVVDKFFQDVLVKAGKLPDDNFEYVPTINATFKGIDKANPRLEITITEL